MTIEQAKAVILTLLSFLDGKPSVVLSNSWKIRLAKAKSVLREAGVYASSEQGMYSTIAINKSNGVAYVDVYPIRDEKAVDGTSTLDELFNSFLAGQSGVTSPTTEPNLKLD